MTRLVFLFSIIYLCLAAEENSRTIVFYTNGGNNTAELSAALELNVPVDINFDVLLARVGAKLNLIPRDCTPFSVSRPKRPFDHVVRAPDPDAEPPFERCSEEIRSWTTRMRLFDSNGNKVESLQQEFEPPLFVVAATDHFVWPGMYVGRKVVLKDTLVDGEPIELITQALAPRLFYIPRFVTDAEADLISTFARTMLQPSYVFENAKSVEVAARNSEQAWLNCNADGNPTEKLICELDKRVANATRIPLEHIQFSSDSLQAVHYGVQQHYHSHHDYFDATLSPDAITAKNGQQRLLTLFWYLNDVEDGGQTVFPRAGPSGYGQSVVWDMSDCSRGVKVTPKKGAAVLWYNLLAPGNGHECFFDPMSLHSGCDVKVGEKFGANKWVYNRKTAFFDPPYYNREPVVDE